MFRKLISGGRKHHAIGSEGAAPGMRGRHEIGFQPDLLDRLSDQHETLIDLFKKILKAAQKRASRSLPDRLKRFENLYFEHALEEKVHLLVYLTDVYGVPEGSQTLLKSHREQLDRLRKRASAFFDAYSDRTAIDADWDGFEAALTQLGADLWRFAKYREEQVFPLYRPQ